MNPSNETPASVVDPTLHETIARRAYELWEQDGSGHGSHERHWRDAEHQLLGTPPAAELHPQATQPEQARLPDDVPHFPPSEPGHPASRPD